MALVVWVVIVWVLVVHLGDWTVQRAAGLFKVGVMAALWLGLSLIGLLSLALLAVADRPRLMRVLREARA